MGAAEGGKGVGKVAAGMSAPGEMLGDVDEVIAFNENFKGGGRNRRARGDAESIVIVGIGYCFDRVGYFRAIPV